MPYIYIIQEREFIKLGENVWKIGFTDKEIWERIRQYPKGSLVIMCAYVENGRYTENIFKRQLECCSEVKTRRDIGCEYFECVLQVICAIFTESLFGRSTKDEELSQVSLITEEQTNVSVVKHNKNMTVKTAIEIASNAPNTDHIKYFKEQLRHFKIDPSSTLKEYFDFIEQDTLTWLQGLPYNARSKSTFNKYKASVNLLLEHDSIVAEYGEQYCETVIRAIKNCFKENIDNVVKQRENRNNGTHCVKQGSDEQDTTGDDSASDEGIDSEISEFMKDDNKTLLDDIYAKYNELHVLHVELQRKHELYIIELAESNAIRRTIEKDKEQMWSLLALALKSC